MSHADPEPQPDPRPDPQPDPQPDPHEKEAPPGRPWYRVGRAQLLVGLLLGLLGFSVVVQARQTSEGGLATLRQSELVRILDSLNERSARLEADTQRREADLADLRAGTNRTEAAERTARERLQVLGILAGTAPASGPGIRLDVTDPERKVQAPLLLDTVQELRDAGAEAIQIGDVRVVASTSFVDTDRGISIDGTAVSPPYRVVAIGDADTMASALDIPGGVLEALRNAGARGEVQGGASLTVSALRDAETPQYARPASAGP